MEKTIDPTTFIVNRTSEYVEYSNTDGKSWRLYGQCNGCGMCEIENNQPIFTSGDIFIQHNKILLEDGTMSDWDRVLYWIDTPGKPGACVEQDFDKRKDIPLTPNCANRFSECSLSGVWLSGN